MKFLKKIEVIIDIFFVGVVISILVTYFSAEVQVPLKHYIESRFPHFPHIFLLLIILGAIITIVVYSFLKRALAKDSKNVTQQQLNDRTILLDSLSRRYDERLRKKMDNDLKLSLELQLRYTKEGTDENYVQNFFFEGYKEALAGDVDTLFLNFKTTIFRLLIIGDPGSGKSTLLLRFAQKIISEAKTTASFPIPVIVNLSSWRNDESFKDWLEQNLVYYAGEFGTSKENAKTLANSYTLVLLLDGLDEIPEKYRESCLKKLKIYLDLVNEQRETTLPEVIICCRREEYKELKTDAPVQASISIEPIHPSQVLNNLHSLIAINPVRASAAFKLIKIIEINPAIKSLLSTAFHFHIALSLATTEHNLVNVTNQSELLKLYIQKELAEFKSYYSSNITITTLVWIANNLKESKKGITFELTDIQPGWLKYKWSYQVVKSFLVGLLFVVLIPGVSFVVNIKEMSTIGRFFLGFTVTFLISINSSIEPDEIHHFNFKKINYFSIAAAFIIAVVSLYGYNLINDLFIRFFSLKFSKQAFYFLTIWATVYFFIMSFFDDKKYPIIRNPYKRFLASSLFNFFSYLGCWLIALFFSSWLLISVNSILMCILLSLAVSIFTSSIIDYIALQFILAITRTTPLNLVKFLNLLSTATGLFEKDGGQWRFRHKLIQDEFYNKKASEFSRNL